MKYKKLLKKAAVSLLLAQSLIFTGLPIQAADKRQAQETLHQLCRRMR